jgi:TolB-like protein
MRPALDSLRESLAPRYDVEREIGVGGMARVYLAVEQHPHRRVAIKVLDPELSTRLLRERFIREVDLASKLTHPHIVPIFAAGEAGGLFYYVMPYIEGESLRHRLRRERRLPLEPALHIVADVADALEFAHSQGIVHRDIKPENILLSSDHAVVADFGIARAISAAGDRSLTQTGQSVGSPGYMSPEQALGLPVDARSDVYSLGCVLFEALAGEPAIVALAERLVHNWAALEASPALKTAPAGVARAVKHAISNAVAPLPDDRITSAGAFVAALGGGRRVSAPTRSIFAGRRGRRLAVAGAALVVLGITTAGIVLRRPSSTFHERRVAVAVIENRTGNPALDNLGFMAADWVTQGLAQTGLVEVVPSLSVMSSTKPAASQSGVRDAAQVRELGRMTGAATVVSGGYYQQGDSLRFQVQITSAQDGRVLRALDPVAAPLSQPLNAIEKLRQRVMAGLASLLDPRLNRLTPASQPPTFEAYQEFIAGLDRFAQFDSRGAIVHFERSTAADTTFLLPLIFAANSHMNVGEFGVAESLAVTVQRHSERLAPLDRAYLAWVLAVCHGDPDRAYQSARAMVDLAPGSDATYLLVEAALESNRPGEAFKALEELDPERGFLRGWWIYWQDRSVALHMMGKHREELKEIEDAARRFPDNLQVLTLQAGALAALGRTSDVRHLLATSENFEPLLGWTAADAMLVAAGELRAHGSPAEADSALAQATAWLATRARTDSTSPTQRYLVALTAFMAGRLDEAQRGFEYLAKNAGAPLESHGWINNPPEKLDYIGYLGSIAARQKNETEALRMDRELEAMKRPYLYGRHTMWRARIHALLGHREQALGLIRDALREGYPHFHSMHTDVALESLRDYLPFQELLKPKD